jgi:hypothetical protein
MFCHIFLLPLKELDGLAVVPLSMGCKLLAESYSSRRTVTDLVGIGMDGILLGSPQVHVLQELFQIPDFVIAHTNSSRFVLMEQMNHCPPSVFTHPLYWPVNKVEVNVAQPEPSQAFITRSQSRIISLIVVPDLSSDEDFFPTKSNFPDRHGYVDFIPV